VDVKRCSKFNQAIWEVIRACLNLVGGGEKASAGRVGWFLQPYRDRSGSCARLAPVSIRWVVAPSCETRSFNPLHFVKLSAALDLR